MLSHVHKAAPAKASDAGWSDVLAPSRAAAVSAAGGLESFIERHQFVLGERPDGSVHYPTPIEALRPVFSEISRILGPLNRRHLLEIGCGDLRVSLYAAEQCGMHVTACEKDAEVHARSAQTLCDATRCWLSDEPTLRLMPPCDALAIPWSGYDVVYCFYTEPKCGAEAFRETLHTKAQEMSGGLFAILFTAAQLASKLDQALNLPQDRQLATQYPLQVSHREGGIYLQLFRPPA